MVSRQNNRDQQFQGAVHREAVSEQITERILSLIREQQLKPGDKLPPERELATLMKVSRATVREAMRSLSMMNVIEMRHGSGTYVTSLDPKLLAENFDLVFSLNDNSLLHLMEARKVLEPGIAALAASRATDDQIAALEDVLERSHTCLHNNPANFPELDIEFHTKVALSAHNPLLGRIMQAIAHMSIASSQRTALLSAQEPKLDIGGVEMAILKHTGILEAIKAHDPTLARDRMIHHMHEVEYKLRNLLRQDELSVK